jgi:hypothetical protein
MFQRYLLSLLIATILLLTGCGGGGLPFGSPTATPIPFALFSAQDVLNAFTAAGLDALNPEPQVTAGRDEPGEFAERYVFEIGSIAPAGGQIIVFSSPDQLAAWQTYIERLRNNSATRRSVIYVYVQNNVMVQLSNLLSNQQAVEYREALEGMNG